jgi:adenylate cyclase
MLDTVESDAIDAFSRWYGTGPSREGTLEAAMTRACELLLTKGFLVRRVQLLILTQHPEVSSTVFTWLRGEGLSQQTFGHDIERSAAYRGSTIETVQTTQRRVRVRLSDPQDRSRYPQLDPLAAQGMTDYFAEPLRFSDGRVSVATFTTDAPEGFSAEAERLLDTVAPTLAVRAEVRSTQHALESLLTTYLGRNAAERVLSGEFRRGTGTTMTAAIWYCDLRRFTELSDRLGAPALMRLLDRYFEAVTAAVEAHGGEILKFIGDAALAVFPVTGDPGLACRRAAAAANDALAALARLNAEGADPEAEPLEAVIALHLGDVFYGNIGGRRRLDFTVIGPAVNEVARIEGLAKTLGVPVVLSREFADAAQLPGTRSLGDFALRGVSVAKTLYTDR